MSAALSPDDIEVALPLIRLPINSTIGHAPHCRRTMVTQ
jgi:hypothetical protein